MDTLHQLRSQLAIDARSLLMTPAFQHFIGLMLQQMQSQADDPDCPLEIAPNPHEWLLLTLPMPLQCEDIQVLPSATQTSASEGTMEMRLTLGNWQQTLTLPTDPAQQWLAAAPQLVQTMASLPTTAASQFRLVQEIVCLVAYVGVLLKEPIA